MGVVITNGPKISCAHEKFIALEKKVIGLNKEFNRKIELGRNLKTIVDKHQFNENIFEGDMKDALQTYKLHGKNMDIEDIEWRGWQRDLRQYLDKPCDRKVIWVVGKEGNEGKSFFQANIREQFGYSRVCTLELSENSRNTCHILGKLCSKHTDIFLFNVPRRGFLEVEGYRILESTKDGLAIDGKYNSQKLNFKQPNVLMVFSNREPDQNKLSKDRWTILKISKDLTELTDIEERKLGKRKEHITHFGAGEVEHEKENIDTDVSGKRKSSEMESDGQMSAKMPKSMIETNQQFGAGRVEPEKEKNTRQENKELLKQSHENESHQVEHEKEKNPQQENVREDVEEYVDQSAFKGRLFSRQYKHRGSNDILQVGQQYKSKIRETVQEHINCGIRFYIAYKVEFEKYDNGEEEMESTVVYLHSGNRRLLDMEEFDEEYDEAMDKIKDELENYTGEVSGWVLDEISSIYLNIARL